MIESLAALRAQTSAPSPSMFNFAEDDPRRLNPLSLEQQKKRAKDLLKQWRTSDDESEQGRKLSEAQHVIAMEHGFKNWAQLKHYIEASRIARETIARGEPSALDAGQRILHIRCGSDIKQALALAGFTGDFLNVPDPYVHGPVPETKTREEFIRLRAEYLSNNHSQSFEQVLQDLSNVYAGLDAAREYDAVYLWFEHDSHDQLMLASLLDYFSDPVRRPAQLRMITITHYPGVKIFNGLGQLPPEAMRILWQQFEVVSPAQLAVGQQAWAAIRSSTPQALHDLIATGTPDIPTMAIALERHLKQLPSSRNGLNLTENLTLQILADKGAMNAARLFGWYNNHYEPLTFMGDTGYWNTLEELAQATRPAIVMHKQSDKPNTWQVELTDTGRGLLENKLDWLEMNTVDRWVGGIYIDTKRKQVYRVAS